MGLLGGAARGRGHWMCWKLRISWIHRTVWILRKHRIAQNSRMGRKLRVCWMLRISWIHRTARRGSQGTEALDVGVARNVSKWTMLRI